ncbi:Exodeoxyribonuclease [BD1-7 clade bacterium]|uniref:Exodeoxyribonuclease n=1 Tax=BD1-7 clade bacterium TaxID=2029982 RepID=A0A5S9N2J6_9GAMM|nr:Exodeoxyribonuclease [BD1-7 clade bacterium]CAA0082710.1 Exodeoxyribonuclease [BD1-7 clade bacterium]
MRIINFSADGIKTAAEKGFFEWLANQDADFVCIQDLRCEEYDLVDDIFFPQGYFAYFFDNPDGLNGVAIYTRKLPKAIMTGLGFTDFDIEARFIQADFDDISIGSILVPPSSLDDVASMERKAQFFDLLYAHLDKIRNKRREFVFAGNWHIAHQLGDIQKDTHDDHPGFLLEERRWLDDAQHQLGYIDAFRQVNHDTDEFSWWPESEDDGWRVDFQLVSEGMEKYIEYGSIYKTKRFSSHAPVIMDFDYPLSDDEF